MCTSINIDGETNDINKGQENLSMLSLLVLSACITFRNFFTPKVSLNVVLKYAYTQIKIRISAQDLPLFSIFAISKSAVYTHKSFPIPIFKTTFKDRLSTVGAKIT